jgi:uncharacterized protein YqjF (DUF2071 family)
VRRDDTPFGRAVGEVGGRIPAEPPPIVGVSQPERVDRLVELARWPIAPEVWDDLCPPGTPPDH